MGEKYRGKERLKKAGVVEEIGQRNNLWCVMLVVLLIVLLR